jgi:hypothetical protein
VLCEAAGVVVTGVPVASASSSISVAKVMLGFATAGRISVSFCIAA